MQGFHFPKQTRARWLPGRGCWTRLHPYLAQLCAPARSRAWHGRCGRAARPWGRRLSASLCGGGRARLCRDSWKPLQVVQLGCLIFFSNRQIIIKQTNKQKNCTIWRAVFNPLCFPRERLSLPFSLPFNPPLLSTSTDSQQSAALQPLPELEVRLGLLGCSNVLSSCLPLWAKHGGTASGSAELQHGSFVFLGLGAKARGHSGSCRPPTALCGDMRLCCPSAQNRGRAPVAVWVWPGDGQ